MSSSAIEAPGSATLSGSLDPRSCEESRNFLKIANIAVNPIHTCYTNTVQQRSIEHAPISKIAMGRSKLVKPLVCRKHLKEGMVPIWSTPGLLDSANMLWFGNWWTVAIRSSKQSNKCRIMHNRVLSWQWESFRTPYWCKNFSEWMKAFYRILQLIQVVFGNYVSACDIAEIEKCTERKQNIRRKMALKGRKINLINARVC